MFPVYVAGAIIPECVQVTTDSHQDARRQGCVTTGTAVKEGHRDLKFTSLETGARAAVGREANEISGDPVAAGDCLAAGVELGERSVRVNSATVGVNCPPPDIWITFPVEGSCAVFGG